MHRLRVVSSVLCTTFVLLASSPAMAVCTPSPEKCDGVDNDCDGLTDRADTGDIVGNFFRFDKPQCEKFVGVCGGAYKTQAFCATAAPWGWKPCTDAYYSAYSGYQYQKDTETGAFACDGKDNDCDGSVDEHYVPTSIVCGVGACQRTGLSACVGGSVVPGACTPGTPGIETCNGVDDDCDGVIDNGVKIAFFRDADGDGYGNAAVSVQACSALAGYVSNATDCDDASTAVHPGALELCNALDDNCDAQIDEGYGIGSACTRGIGACADTGTMVCITATQSACTVTGKPAGTPCDDLDPCTSNEACTGGEASACQGVALTCDDNSLCTNDACVPDGSYFTTGNGAGTVDLPVRAPDSSYSSNEILPLVNGFPAGSSLVVYYPSFGAFDCPLSSGICSFALPDPGAECTLGTPATGERECASARMPLNMEGRDGLAFFRSWQTVPITFETTSAPHTPGTPVQSFDTEMLRLSGQITGDPDFDLLRVTAGSDYGLPSPGHTTLTQLPGGKWAVDSFFDITYRIDYVGRPGSRLEGVSGSTTGTLRFSVPKLGPGGCVHTGVDCDDHDACTQEWCGPDLGCGHFVTTCDDYDQCTADWCDPLTGACVYAPIPGCGCVQTDIVDTTCDGIDDDCDGVIDDDYVVTGTTCGLGVCAREGMLTCANGLEGNSCAPGAATGADADCNGLDDDCDGAVDNHFVVTGTICGIGECKRTGQLTCANGRLANSCVPGQPWPEICDGKDNDCNGKTDAADGARMLVNDQPWCEKQAGACAGSKKTAAFCSAGRWKPCNDAVYKYWNAAYLAIEVPGCDGKDNDCDQQTDEAWFTSTTTCGVGVCANTGVLACIGGRPTNTCQWKAPTGDDTDCDNLDDDCDGLVDNHYVADTSCFLPGVCAVGNHASTCVAGVQTPCTQTRSPLTNYDECNGLDDDCNGQVDEDQPVIGEVWCGVGACQAFGMKECQGGVGVDVCTPGEPLAADDVTCDGIDDDCDSDTDVHPGGGTDEDYMPYPSGNDCGVGACAAIGEWLCVTDPNTGVTAETDVCTPGVGEVDCDDNNPCTVDRCVAYGSGCAHDPTDDWAPCTFPGVAFGLCLGTTCLVAACQPGFFGPSCLACPPCAHGLCSDGLGGSGDCVCNAGYAGVVCDECAPGYSGYPACVGSPM